MSFNDQNRICHAEPIRFAQGKLREASLGLSRETLRFAQGDNPFPILLVKVHNRAATNDFVYIRSSGIKPRTRSALFMVCTVARTNKVRNDFTRSSASLRIGGVCS